MSVEGRGLGVRCLGFAIRSLVPEGFGQGAPFLEEEAFLGGRATSPSRVSGRERTLDGERF